MVSHRSLLRLVGFMFLIGGKTYALDLAYADYKALLSRKAAMAQKEPRYLARLIKRADLILDKDPESVMLKKAIPPSGDKHDYMSVAPYWWPDPKKPDGLPYIRRDGRVNPTSRGEGSDYQAAKRLFDRVNALGMAAFYTDDPRYARKAVELLDAWFVNPKTRMNPHLEFAQAVPGRSKGRCFGIIEWCGIEKVITPIQLLRASGKLPASTDRVLTAWFEAYLKWVRTSEMGKKESTRSNNHATWYDVQVAGLCLFLGKKKEAREVLEAVKTKRIATQIEPDGRQPHELARTKSMSYSKMNLSAFLKLAKLGDKAGVDLLNYETPDGRSIRKAQAFLEQYGKGKKKWPYQQL